MHKKAKGREEIKRQEKMGRGKEAEFQQWIK